MASDDSQMWKYSTLVDAETVRQTGCFTTLPVRINRRDDLANAASNRVLKDWAAHTGNTAIDRNRVSFSPVGSFCSLIYCETIPERLDSISYLTDLFFLIDDATEEVQSDKVAQEEWTDFSGAMTSTLNDAPARDHDLEFLKKKKLVAKVMLEFMRLDPVLGLDLCKSCKAGWTPLAAGVEWATMEEYLKFRRLSAGLDIYWTKTVFGHGEKLSDDEEALIRPLTWAAEKAAMLNNDYWSWDIEYFQTGGQIEGLTNAVAVLMRKEGLSAQEGKERIKNMIVGFEGEYSRLRAEFYQAHPNARLYLRKRVELLGAMAAGVSFWSANSPRYHVPSEPGEKAAAAEVAAAAATPEEKTELEVETPGAEAATVDGSTTSSVSDEYHDASDAASDSDKGSATTSPTEPSSSCSQILSADTSPKPSPPTNPFFDVPKLDSSVLDAPIAYIQSMPSKGVRSSLIDAMNAWFQVPSSSLSVVKRAIDLLHNASLILDDIQDDSPLRRSRTATHLVYGPAQAINSATALYVRVVQEVADAQNPALLKVLLNELDALHVGQSWDLYWKFNLKAPSEAEYFSMVDMKTGGLFRMLVRMMQTLSPVVQAGARKDRKDLNDDEFLCGTLVSMVGRFFQVRDDYLNLSSSTYTSQKGWCEDLDEAKFSYLIVHALAHGEPALRDRVLGLFRQSRAPGTPMPNPAKVQVLEWLREAGSFEACWALLDRLEDEIEAEIERLEEVLGEENPQMHLLLNLLSVKGEKPSKGPVAVPAGL